MAQWTILDPNLVETPKMDKEELDRMIQQATSIANDNIERLRKGVEKKRNNPPPMDTAEKLHESLTRSFAVLHKIAQLPCQIDPEGAAEHEAQYAFRKPCASAECASCLAYRALRVEGQLPY